AGLLPELVTPAQAQEAIRADYDVNSNGDVVLVPLTLNGVRRSFVVDTGAQFSMYDARLSPQLGPIRGPGNLVGANGASQVVEMFDAPLGARIGDLRVHDGGRVFAVDLAPMRKAAGLDIDGVLGMDFLGRHVVQLDVANGRVSFMDSVPPMSGKESPLVFNRNGLPAVELSLGERLDAAFVIDTGFISFDECGIEPQLLIAVKRQGGFRPVSKSPTTTLTGEEQKYSGVLSALRLDGFMHRNLLATSAKFNSLSLEYLSRYVATFDFPNATLYLRRSRIFDRPMRRDLSGLSMLREHGRTVIDMVHPGGNAEKAGVMAGDILIRIDNFNASTTTLRSMRTLLTRSGETALLTLRREEKLLTIGVALR
ncbi:MAG TPA: aspartyl protease family protein, partial [Pirellulales bacterium]|nr:aspartyl protease family protein [Pirellulales bacterium]